MEGRKEREGEQETVESPGRRERKDGWKPGRWDALRLGHRGSARRGGRAAEVRGPWNAGNRGRRRPRGGGKGVFEPRSGKWGSREAKARKGASRHDEGVGARVCVYEGTVRFARG